MKNWKCLCEMINCEHLIMRDFGYCRCKLQPVEWDGGQHRYYNVEASNYSGPNKPDTWMDYTELYLKQPIGTGSSRFYNSCPNIEKLKIIMELNNL